MLSLGNSRPSIKAAMIKTLLLTTFLLFIIIYDKSLHTKPFDTRVFHQAFRFHVHCPVTSQKDGSFLHLMNHLDITDSILKDKIFKELLQMPTYVIFMKAFATDPNNISNSSVIMSYCGFARLKNETDCSNAELLCTVPGPMIIVPKNQTIDIIWINQINGTGLNWTEVDHNCYGENAHPDHCFNAAKSQLENLDCTFNAPDVPITSGVKLVKISSSAIPIAPHIHGLEGRPSSEGGPFSWFNNVGDIGPAYFSMSTNNYYNSFFKEQTPFLKGLLTPEQANKIKANRYKNDQPPGMLFYHDHAMKSTLTNNLRGTEGFYLIVDPEQQKILPVNEQQYLFAFHFFNQGDLRINQDRKYLGEGKVFPFIGPIQDNSFLYGNQYVYRNMTYRWKMLNSHFDTTYNNISFAAFYRQLKDQNGYLYVQELEPPLNCDNQSFFDNLHSINFTVIGMDAATLGNAVHNVSQFSLGAAERIQLLIKYDSVPQNINHVYVVALDNLDDEPRYVVKLVLTLHPQPVDNQYKDPQDFNDLNASFIDLSGVPQSQIPKKRMRALIARPFQQLFTINQHAQVTLAACQNPQIGTIEDWYIINTMEELHPMHFHVVNFQKIQSYRLKVTAEGCSLYELDFFRESNISMFQIDDNAELCYLLGNITLDEILALSDQFNKYNLENQFVNGISGKNVMEKIDNSTNFSMYDVPDCSLNIYKYICNETSHLIPKHQRGWKDTTKVFGFSVAVLRVRWTKTLYNPAVGGQYFAYQQAEMLQWPGTVYHCHMLMHAQKVMVRPIMFQPSQRFKATHQLSLYDCNYANWADKYKCINNALNCSY